MAQLESSGKQEQHTQEEVDDIEETKDESHEEERNQVMEDL